MIGDIKKFRFWCQKVIPLVYDNSLSYYEVLCKVVDYLNKVIKDMNEIPSYIDAKIEEALDDEHIKELIEEVVANIESAISSNNEHDNTNSSADYNIGQMLWWNGKLYKVIRAINAGDTFIVDTNIELVNFEDLFNLFIEEIKHDITTNDDGSNTTASQNWTSGTWLWLNDNLYIVTEDIAQGNAYILSGDNANVEALTVEEAIQNTNSNIANIMTMIGDISELTTSDADDIVQAINSIINERGALSDLDTTNKNSIVGAINEVKTGLIYATPEQYGAVGDGVTDDTQAIQDAIDNNNYVIANGNYAFTEININGFNKVVEFNGTLNHIGSVDNFAVKTSAFSGIETVSSWAGEYVAINKYAIRLSGRWCNLKVNKITTSQLNTVAVLLFPEGEDSLVDHCNVDVQYILTGFACGVLLYAEAHQNVQYNSLSIRQAEGSISSIAMIASENDGYVNANYFYDTQIQNGGIDLLFQNLDSDYASDNWFEHVSFEGVSRSNTVRCYNLRNGGFKEFRYEEVATIPMAFVSCTKILLKAFTYFVFSTSLSLSDCTEIIFKGYITIAGGSRLVDEDIATWKYVSQNVNASDNLTDVVGISGTIKRFGNLVEVYINGTSSITVPANGSIKIGAYADRYMSEHDDLYYPVVGDSNLLARFKTREIKIVNISNASISVTLKPQIFRWLTNRIFV